MIRVYVAGKYSDNNILGCLGNIGRGIQLCKDLFLMGYAPFCPWLDHQYVLHMTSEEKTGLSVSMFHEYSITWLDASDCILVIPDRIESSNGVQKEISRAKELGLPIFYTVEGLNEYRHRVSEVSRG